MRPSRRPLGWAFAIGRGHSWILETHRWLGTAGACWLLALLVISEISRKKPGGWRAAYLAGLFLAVPAVGAIGFFGGAMVYGLHEYDWPSAQPEGREVNANQSSESDSSTAVVVSMTDDMTFAPAVLTIPVGTTVQWENSSKDDHTVTGDSKRAGNPKDVKIPKGAEPFDSGTVKPGGSFFYTFVVPGTYKYVCVPHEMMGMYGEIDVTVGR